MIRKIITGEYQPHLEPALFQEVRGLKQVDPLEPVVITVPTNVLGRHLSRSLAKELGGHAEIRFLTLLDLARRLGARALSGRGLAPMSPMADVLLLRRSIEKYLDAHKGSYFGQVAKGDGFLRVLLAAIVDLKEGCLSPADLHRAVGRAGLGAVAGGKAREVAGLWRTYEEGKRAAGLYDRADLMAEASSGTEAGSWISDVSCLLFYGFYDLNPLQRRLVETCAGAKDTVFFTPFVDSDDFDYARPTLDWLRGMGFKPEAEDRGGDVAPSPDAGAGAREIGGPGGGVLVLSAAGEERECRETIREVLRLAGLGRDGKASDSGFRFNELGILLRDPARYVGHLTRLFEGLGVEPFVGEGLPLSKTRAGRSLSLLMELIDSDLSRREVMDFLTYADLNLDSLMAGEDTRLIPESPVNPALWDLVSIEAGIVEGVNQWREKLSALLRREGHSPGHCDDEEIGTGPGEAGARGAGEDEPGGVEGNSHARAASAGPAVAALLAVVEHLSDKIASLRAAGSPALLVEDLCAFYCSLVAPGDERDAVVDALRRLSALESCSRSIDRSSFFWLVRRHLESTQTRIGSLHGQGPVVAGLMTSRGLPFKVVVVPGLTEGWFPMAARQDPVLLDGERRALNGAFEKMGINGRLGLKSERTKEERLLFRLALGAASERLLLSYSRVEPMTGAERNPSEFLLDAARSIAGTHCDARTLETLSFYRRIPIARLFPDDSSFIDQTEFDLMAADRAVAGEAEAIDYLKSGDNFLARSLEAEKRRWGEFRFTPYDGVMKSAEAIKLLRGRFIGRHGFASPTALESYADCPFLYFMRYILNIEALEEPEDVLSLAPVDKGALAHSILEKAYGEIFREGKGPCADWRGRLSAIASEILEAFGRRNPFGLPLLWDLEGRRLVEDLVASAAKDLQELGGFAPWRFELRYGIEGSDDEAGPPELPLEGGRSLPLGGKIDRVDVNRSEGTARVIDYKTGSGKRFKDDRLVGGTTLQLPLYVLGARHVLGDAAEVIGAEYYFVSGARLGGRVRFSSAALRERMADVVSIVNTIARCIEKGIFFAYPGDSCAYCDYRMACAPAQALFERKQTDPMAQEFLRMKEID